MNYRRVMSTLAVYLLLEILCAVITALWLPHGERRSSESVSWATPTLTAYVSQFVFAVVLIRSGSLFGVVLNTGQGDGSTRLIENMPNQQSRGFFFEAAGTRSIIIHNAIIQGNAISPANLLGAGAVAKPVNLVNPDGSVTTTSVEGDPVADAGGGQGDLIDFKARGVTSRKAS